MPLLLLDLDDTLIDRAGAYQRWAASFAVRHGREQDADWLVEVDNGGYASRKQLADLVRVRFGLMDVSTDALVDELRQGLVEHMHLDPDVPPALARARAAGWILQVVTNGTLEQQERKLRRTGLDRLVDGWIISEAVGLHKPDPRIFALAARKAGCPLDGAWVVGDCPDRDIAGAIACGLRSAWLHRGRTWGRADLHPTVIASSVADAWERVVLSSG